MEAQQNFKTSLPAYCSYSEYLSILAPFSQLSLQTTLRTDFRGKLIPSPLSAFCIKNRGWNPSPPIWKGNHSFLVSLNKSKYKSQKNALNVSMQARLE